MALGLLPYTARDTLQNCGYIDNAGIAALLLSDINLVKQSIYPLAKAYHGSFLAQKDFFERITKLLVHGSDELVRGSFLMKEARSLPSNCRVEAAQLVQMSWCGGFDVWDRMYREIAEECPEKKQLPILVAYATLAGFPFFVEFLDYFSVLIPGWLEERRNPYCGYVFLRNLSRIGVQLVNKGTRYPANPLIIDDTVRTGRTRDRVLSYLASCGNNKAEFMALDTVGP